MTATRHRIAGGLLVAAALTVAAGAANGQREGREPPRVEVHGVVKALDPAARTITVSIPEGRQQAAGEKTYSLAADVEVGLGNGGGRRTVFQEGKVADLVPGAQVNFILSADQKAVEVILAEGPTLRGHIKAIDLSKHALTVEVFPTRAAARDERPAPEEKTYTLIPDAEVAVDDGRGRSFSIKEAKLADLATGSAVIIRLTVDQKKVQAVFAEGPTLFGTVKAVDAAKNSLTVVVPPGRGADTAEEKTLTVAPDAVALIDNGKGRRFSLKEGKLADVPAGSAVQLRLSADQKTVAMLRAEGPNVPGLVKAVDADKSTITVAVSRVRGENPEEKTLPVAKDARILIDGTAGKLGDIKVEERGPFAQLRLSLDQKTVQAIQVGRGR